MPLRIFIVLLLSCLGCTGLSAQTFSLVYLCDFSDSCCILVLETDSTSDAWSLPYPVYQFRTGDVDGDGVEEALVGVVKSTRFYPEKGNRLFVFKNRDGRVRPLWLGSRLGEELVDFCVADGKLISIERCRNGQYNLDEWEWSRFGPRFSRYIMTNATAEEVQQTFNQYEKNTGHSSTVDAHPHGMEPTK
jgi:hypothetical protein